MKKKEEYYQTIARRLFRLRGTPFFLSAREVQLVQEWEALGIPLRVVLEGMASAYQNHRSRSTRGRGKFTLAYCRKPVLQAHQLYRDRYVGDRRTAPPRQEKIDRIRREIQRFLKKTPNEVSYLADIFVKIARDLDSGMCRTEQLENIDEKVEEVLFENASPKEREQAAAQILKEHGIQNHEELEDLIRVQMVKTLRDTYKIPYVSPYYY